MPITIHRDNGNFGPYTLEQVNAMLASGQLAADDLAWQEGTADWVPLADLQGVLQVPPPRPGARAMPGYLRPTDESDRQILPAFLLAFFIGPFGIHRFYVGKIGTAILMIVTLGGLGIWVLVDFIMILMGNFKDKEEKPLINW